jgi:arylsulfatase
MKCEKTINSLLLSALAASFGCQQQGKDHNDSSTVPPFKGKISLDVRESEPDWGPFLPKKAPEGAPNVLFVL